MLNSISLMFLLAQDASYNAMGSNCSGPGFSVSRLGEYLLANRQAVESRVIAGSCMILPEDSFSTIGFTSAEMKQYALSSSWGSASISVRLKLDTMMMAFASYRAGLIQPQADTTPPVITVSSPTASSSTATLSWSVNELSSFTFRYSTPAGDISLPVARGTSGSVSLAGLQPAFTYQYYVTATDSANNTSTSSRSFTTNPEASGLLPQVETVDLSSLSLPGSEYTMVLKKAPVGAVVVIFNSSKIGQSTTIPFSGLDPAFPKTLVLTLPEYRPFTALDKIHILYWSN